MSYAMSVARYGNMGDPGLFGFLGNAIKGTIGGFLTGGPAGAILGAAGSVAGAIARPSVKQAKAATMFPQISQTRPTLPGTGGFSGVNVGGPSGVTIGTVKPGGATTLAPARPTPLLPSGSTAQYAPKQCGIAGYHYNKTTYHTATGTVPRGTKCVRNRKRNPLNPRALSRAMSRVASAQKAVRCLKLFAGAPTRASHAANNGRKRVGCKSCKSR
jgi:hypothetical protein